MFSAGMQCNSIVYKYKVAQIEIPISKLLHYLHTIIYYHITNFLCACWSLLLLKQPMVIDILLPYLSAHF